MSHAVVIFARSPEREARAKGLPERSGALLFRALIAAWIRAARRAGATPIIASTEADRRALLAIAGRAEWIEQRGEGFGQRLAAAAAGAFARGYGAILIGGIDAPPPQEIAPIFETLEGGKARAVVVPARDGGVNMIALRAPALDLLGGIRLGQRDVVARFRERVPDLITLPVQSDIDSPADIAVAAFERGWMRFRPLLLGCLPRTSNITSDEGASSRASAVRVSRAPPRVR